MSDRIRELNKLADSRFGSCRYAKTARKTLIEDLEENGVRGGVGAECEKNSTVGLLTVWGTRNLTDV